MWEGNIDCSVTTCLNTMLEINDCQQLIMLVHNGDLNVEGDIQIIQNFVVLTSCTEFNFDEILAAYTGDIVSECLKRILNVHTTLLQRGKQRHRQYGAEIIIKKCRLSPGIQELKWFFKEVDTIQNAIDILTMRIENWRVLNDTK